MNEDTFQSINIRIHVIAIKKDNVNTVVWGKYRYTVQTNKSLFKTQGSITLQRLVFHRKKQTLYNSSTFAQHLCYFHYTKRSGICPNTTVFD